MVFLTRILWQILSRLRGIGWRGLTQAEGIQAEGVQAGEDQAGEARLKESLG